MCSATAAAEDYLYVQDCIDAMHAGHRQRTPRGSTSITSERTNTARSRETGRVGFPADRRGAEFSYSGGERGWIGDSPFIWLKCDRIRALGWKPKLTIRTAVERTVDYLQAHSELLEVQS